MTERPLVSQFPDFDKGNKDGGMETHSVRLNPLSGKKGVEKPRTDEKGKALDWGGSPHITVLFTRQ